MRLRVFCLVALLLVALLPTAAQAQTANERFPQLVLRENFEQLATDRLEQALTEAKETRRHTIEAVRVPMDTRLPAGNITYEVLIPNGLRYRSMMPVYIEININGAFYRRITCTMRVHVFEKMVTAAQPLQPEKPLTTADLRVEERELENVTYQYFTEPEEVTGKVLNRLVREGTVLSPNMLRNPIIIFTNAMVNLVVDYNGVKVKTEGIALQAGRAGDVIRVRNTRSGRTVQGHILDAQNVEVFH